MTLGEKLQGFRKRSGLSQEQLSAQLGVSRQAISKWELGESVPETENIVQLSKLFSVSCDYLLLDEVETITAASHTSSVQTEKQQYAVIAHALGLALCASGLLIAVAGWNMWQTALPVAIGLIAQVMGIMVFEIINYSADAVERLELRKRFWKWACWMVAPVPVAYAVTVFWNWYPKAVFSLYITASMGLVYLLVCGGIVYSCKRKLK